jgi:hypothetical protein
MRALLRPVGPLPASVYWVRRLVLLAVVGLVIYLVVGLLRPDEPERSASPRSSPSRTPAALITPTNEPTGGVVSRPKRSGGAGASGSGDQPTAQEQGAARGSNAKGSGPAPTSPEETSPEETGPANDKATKGSAGQPEPCWSDQIRVAMEVEDDSVAAGQPLAITLNLDQTASAPCRLTIGPDTLRLRITSGSDLIWDSEQCPAALPRGPVVLEPGRTSSLVVTWPGRRSAHGCPSDTAPALPGYYHAWATVADVDHGSVRFRLT